MLTKLGVSNFKVFEEKQEIKFGKKFTLIYGSNSSGKSSLFQAIQIIKESLGSPESGFKYMGIQGEMNDFINKKNKNKEKKMNLSFEVDSNFRSRIRTIGPLGSGLSGTMRILDKYPNIIYPIKFGVDFLIKLEKDDAKLEKISFNVRFNCEEKLNHQINKKKLKEYNLLILELNNIEKIKKNNLKKYFPTFKGKYDAIAFKDMNLFKVNKIIDDDKTWKSWWEFKIKYLSSYEHDSKRLRDEEQNLLKRIDNIKKKVKELKEANLTIIDRNKQAIKKLKEIKKKKLKTSIDLANEIIGGDLNLWGTSNPKEFVRNQKNEEIIQTTKLKDLLKEMEYIKKEGNDRLQYRSREFERTYPSTVINELKKFKTYKIFKHQMILDIKKNLFFTSTYLDFSKNIGQIYPRDLQFSFRSLKPIGLSLFEKLTSSFQYGRYFRNQSTLPLINISRFPDSILSSLNKQIFRNIFTVHSTESEFDDSYRMRQENYSSVGRDGRNTPYILMKNKKTLDAVNKILENAMNIELSLAKTRVQGENHFIFRAKDTFSGRQVNTVKMKLAGKGFNSIIPYLTEIMMHENSMILLEEIENSLHPKIISPLINSLLNTTNKNSYVLETHSKHIVLKLQQLVKRKIINKDDVAINYVERKKNGSKINHIPLDENGDFTMSWPEGGFFPEESKIILE